MSYFSLSAMPQQLELDLWQILAVAQAEPATASMVILCRHLEGLDLVDGARAIGELGEIYRSRAEVILAEIAAAYLPEQEPIVDDELWAHLYPRTFVLRDEHLYLEQEHDYPESRQSVIKLGVEADELISDELRKAEVARQILGNAHSEDVELWAAQIRASMANCGEMRLLELQRRSGLPLVDVWLGLLLGDTGCLVRRRSWGVVDSEGFYEGDGLWVK
jgi:hypothetical protein